MSKWWFPEIREQELGNDPLASLESKGDEKGFVIVDSLDELIVVSKVIKATSNSDTRLRSISDAWHSAQLYEMFLLNVDASENDFDKTLVNQRDKIRKEWQCLLAAYALCDDLALDMDFVSLKLSKDKQFEEVNGVRTQIENSDYRNEYARAVVGLLPQSSAFEYNSGHDKNQGIAEWKNTRSILIKISGSDTNNLRHNVTGYAELALESPTTIIIPANEDWKVCLDSALRARHTQWDRGDGWDFIANAKPEHLMKMLVWLHAKRKLMEKSLSSKKITKTNASYFDALYGKMTPGASNEGLLYNFMEEIRPKLEANQYSSITISSYLDRVTTIIDRDESLTIEKLISSLGSMPDPEPRNDFDSSEMNLRKASWFAPHAYIDWVERSYDDHNKTDYDIKKEFSAIDDRICIRTEMYMNGNQKVWRLYFVPMPLTEGGFKRYKEKSSQIEYTVSVSSGGSDRDMITLSITIKDESVSSRNKLETVMDYTFGATAAGQLKKIDSGIEETKPYYDADREGEDIFDRFNASIWPNSHIPNWNYYFLHNQSQEFEKTTLLLRPLPEDMNEAKSQTYRYKGKNAYRDGLSNDDFNVISNFRLNKFPEYLVFGKAANVEEDDMSAKNATIEHFGYIRMSKRENNSRLNATAGTCRAAVDLGTSSTMCFLSFNDGRSEALGDEPGHSEHFSPGFINVKLDTPSVGSALRNSAYFFGENPFYMSDMAIQTLLHLGYERVSVPANKSLVLNYRMFNTKGVPSSTEHSGGELKTNVKWDFEDREPMKWFLDNIVLGIFLAARYEGCGIVEPYIAYPGAFGGNIDDYVNSAADVFKNLAADAGIQLSPYKSKKNRGMRNVSESEAVARYVRNEHYIGGTRPPQICVLDVGGGTTDIYCLFEADTKSEFNSVEYSWSLGAREVLVQTLIASAEVGKGLTHIESILKASKRGEDFSDEWNLEIGWGAVLNDIKEAYNPTSQDSDINKFKSKFETVLNEQPKKYSKPSSNITIGEALAHNLSHNKLATEEEDLMLRTLISLGFAAVFYFTGKMLREAGVKNKNLVIQLTGNGSKIKEWISRPDKTNKNVDNDYFIKQMLIAGLRDGAEGNESPVDEGKIFIKYEKDFAKREVAKGMLFKKDKEEKINKTKKVDLPKSSGQNEDSLSEIRQFLMCYNDIVKNLNALVTYGDAKVKPKPKCLSEIEITADEIDDVFKICATSLEEKIQEILHEHAKQRTKNPPFVYVVLALLELLRFKMHERVQEIPKKTDDYDEYEYEDDDDYEDDSDDDDDDYEDDSDDDDDDYEDDSDDDDDDYEDDSDDDDDDYDDDD